MNTDMKNTFDLPEAKRDILRSLAVKILGINVSNKYIEKHIDIIVKSKDSEQVWKEVVQNCEHSIELMKKTPVTLDTLIELEILIEKNNIDLTLDETFLSEYDAKMWITKISVYLGTCSEKEYQSILKHNQNKSDNLIDVNRQGVTPSQYFVLFESLSKLGFSEEKSKSMIRDLNFQDVDKFLKSINGVFLN